MTVFQNSDAISIIHSSSKTASYFRLVPDEAIAFTQSGEPF
ncbi:hypothetical protein [Nostoc sp. TCL26-01]|nr:hypothetical protein [Nostoc sp. TCL26-01]